MTTEEYQGGIKAPDTLRFRAITSRSVAGSWEVVLAHKLYQSGPLNKYQMGKHKARLYAWWLNLTRNPNLGEQN